MDSDGKILEIEDSFGVEVSYEYDDKGYLQKVITENGIENFSYKNGDLIEFVDSSKNATKYEYDKNHNLIKVTDSEGSIFHYEYTDNNRLFKIKYPNSYVENFK